MPSPPKFPRRSPRRTKSKRGFGTLDFKDGAQNKETLDKLYDNLDFTYAFRAFTRDGVKPYPPTGYRHWNYTVRLYRPRKEILDRTWKFPEAQAQ